MMCRPISTAKRLLVHAAIALAVAAPAYGDSTHISNVPLATSAGTTVLPNLLFTLDASGSMDSDYLPDYVNDSNKCMNTSGGSTNCGRGDPPYEAGGQFGFNGVGYDPNVNYLPGLKSDGTTVQTAPLTTTAVPNDAYGAQSNSTTNITSGITDKQFCNPAGTPVCKRNGADSAGASLVSGTDAAGNTMAAGQFPYRTHASNSSTAIFGLPEMMSQGSFTRSGSAVTVTTVEAHGLAVSNTIYTTGTGTSGVDLNAVTVGTVPNTHTFTYTGTSSGTMSAKNGSYRKHSTGTWSISSGTVTVTSNNHGLVVNDLIYANPSSSFSTGAFTVKAVTANAFSYSSGTGSGTPTGTWVRTGLYNVDSTVSGPAISYSITPVEYCSDENLTNCSLAATPGTAPAGFPFPAYVRFCQTQAPSVAPGAVSGNDASGNALCRSKYVNSGIMAITYTFPRFGRFSRDTIQSSVGSYARGPDRSDCTVAAGASTCTYTQEIQNYARWYAYYRTRMQMMKTAAGRAFQGFISNPSATPPRADSLRVGFIIINPVYPSGYLKIDNFNTIQASNWYTKFYAQVPNQSTPLRTAIARAGWIFAGKLNTGLTAGIPVADDPVQASCQRNFTLMTTDGFWNGTAGQTLGGKSIGNYDNVDPTIVAPYTQPLVDRATTGTFDGGGATTTTNVPTSEVTEQKLCSANNNTTFSTNPQTACGCASGEHRIKQRIIATGAIVVVTEGVQTSSTTGSTTVFGDLTACSAQFAVTTDTLTTIVEQQVVAANANSTFAAVNGVSAGMNQAGTCAAGQERIKQRTTTYDTTQVTTDGVAAPSSKVNTSYAFTDVGACVAPLVVTAVTPTTRVEEQVVLGTASSTFTAVNGVSAGMNQVGTCLAGMERVKRRTTNYITTGVTTDGVAGAPTTSGTTYTLADVGACVLPLKVTTITAVTETAQNVCSANNNTTFSAAANGSNTQTGCGCGGSSPTRRSLKQRGLGYNITVVTTDGVAGSPSYSPNTSGPSFSTIGTACVTGGGPSVALSPNPTVVNGSSTNTSTGGPTPVPAATTTNIGATTTTTTGGPTPGPAAATTTTNGATSSTSTGTPLTVTLSPNPKTTLGGAPISVTTPGGSADTLADTALYYYQTDLRNGIDLNGDATGPAMNLGGTGTVDVSANDIPAKAGAKDFVTHQHMVTFTVGMADGLMKYRSDYDTATAGDFYNIKQKTVGACFWTPGFCDWPAPAADDSTALDDLWHAAVNGRGNYYQAVNVTQLSQGLQSALTTLTVTVAAAAASATSSPNVTQTDNQIFSTTYETVTWSGKVFSQTIDPVTGNVAAAHQWDADTLLLIKLSTASDTRAIWMLDTASSTLKSFTWASLTAAEQAWFSNKCTPDTNMTQCPSTASPTLSPTQLADANDGSKMLGFLRGWQQGEGTSFRDRLVIDPATNQTTNTVLGDTISAKPAFVRNPILDYKDAVAEPYSTFKANNASRAPRVYVGANDGFLHAFDGTSGDEVWAYAPRFLMPGLWQLANRGYSAVHTFFVDGSPETGDVFDTGTGTWKTILVGGASGGGRGFYALDINNPSSPKALWEFCSDSTLCLNADSDLGLSYGNPVIGKRSFDGKWVVVLTSGLNNTVSPATGQGFFYVLDAITGAVLNKVGTGVGSTATPSGLMKIAPFFIQSANLDASFQYVYGGDQLGNVWRLDLSTATPTVLHIARLMDGSATPLPQPITTKPALTHIGTANIIYIGTGRYLGDTDLSDHTASGIAWRQTLYAFKDKNSDYGTNLRANATLVVQSLTSISPTERGVTNSPVDWATKDGWMLDFNPVFAGGSANGDSPGEAVNIDPRLVLGTLVVVTNAPNAGGACAIGGSSFEYNFDFKTGGALATSTGGVVGKSLGGTIAVGMAIVQLPSGAIKDIITGADTSKTTTDVNVNPGSTVVKRFSYRER